MGDFSGTKLHRLLKWHKKKSFKIALLGAIQVIRETYLADFRPLPLSRTCDVTFHIANKTHSFFKTFCTEISFENFT